NSFFRAVFAASLKFTSSFLRSAGREDSRQCVVSLSHLVGVYVSLVCGRFIEAEGGWPSLSAAFPIDDDAGGEGVVLDPRLFRTLLFVGGGLGAPAGLRHAIRYWTT